MADISPIPLTAIKAVPDEPGQDRHGQFGVIAGKRGTNDAVSDGAGEIRAGGAKQKGGTDG